MINLFLWAVIGGLAGLFGGPFIIGGKDSEMNKMNIIIGLAGGILTGSLALVIGGGALGIFSLPCLIFALIGSVGLLVVVPREHTMSLLKKKKPKKSLPHSDCYILSTPSGAKTNKKKRRP